MAIELISEQVDFFEFPKIDDTYKANKGAQFTFGNLDGNAIKLLYLLIKHGIATNINAEQYERLVSIYTTPIKNITVIHLNSFNLILNKIKFNNAATIRILGGACASGGNNDYFTLKMLEKLSQHKVPLEILLSKNSAEFIEAYEKNNNFQLVMMAHRDAGSMGNLQKLIDNHLIVNKEITEISENIYKPSLKAISYTLNEQQTEMTIYSHAGIGRDTIQKIAEKLGIPYADNTIIELARTIEAINLKFQDHVTTNTVHTLYDRQVLSSMYHNPLRRKIDLSQNPFELLMWNCQYHNIDRSETHLGYKLNFVHVHDPEALTKGNIFNLNSNTNKQIGESKNQYRGIYSHEGPIGLDLLAQLDVIKLKAEALKKGSHATAAVHADRLWATIKEAAQKYFNKTIEKEAFRTICIQEINTARTILETHHGWKQVLSNVGLAIAGLGIGYVLAGLINKKTTGNFLFFGADFPKKLDVLENTVVQIAAAVR